MTFLPITSPTAATAPAKSCKRKRTSESPKNAHNLGQLKLTEIAPFMLTPHPDWKPKIGGSTTQDVNNPVASDVILRVDGRIYFAHWAYLEQNEYFKAHKQFAERNSAVIDVSCVSSEV